MLIVGGTTLGSTTLSSAELYDPDRGAFTPTGSLLTVRASHTATLLPNGKVLIASGHPGSAATIASTELYDPVSGTFSASGDMITARQGVIATLLPNGKVLITGGATCELYDPANANGTFSATGSMVTPRGQHAAALLPSGKVLIAGGITTTELSSTELYDPVTETFIASGNMVSPRRGHTATPLPTGKVLIAGGHQGGIYYTTAELYDPATGTFAASTASMTFGRSNHTATLLPNGKVMLNGGINNLTVIAWAAIFDSGAGFADARRPNISAAPLNVNLPSSITLAGIGFQGDSEGSSGSFNSSPSNFPILHLRRVDNGQQFVVMPGAVWSDTNFTSATLDGMPNGHYQTTLVVNGIPSQQRIILLTDAPAPTITSIAPMKGPLGGGQTVTITGTNLEGGSAAFGGSGGTVDETTSTSITVNTPARAAGVVDVSVTTSLDARGRKGRRQLLR